MTMNGGAVVAGPMWVAPVRVLVAVVQGWAVCSVVCLAAVRRWAVPPKVVLLVAPIMPRWHP